MISLNARAQLDCHDVEPLLGPCADGELLDDDSAFVGSHVARCDVCRKRLVDLHSLKTALSSAGRSFHMPEELEAKLRLDLDHAARPARWLRASVLGAGALAALLVGVVAVASRGPALVTTPPMLPTPPTASAALLRHRADLPVDVASPDPGSVQRFLTMRLGHPLRVPRLDGLGFALVGGRLVDVEDRPAAQLSYSGGYGQRVSVVAVPDKDGSLGARVLPQNAPFFSSGSSGKGLSIRMLVNQGTLYTIIGDVEEPKLARIALELERAVLP